MGNNDNDIQITIVDEEGENSKEQIEKDNSCLSIATGVVATLVCIGIGILCVMIALEDNKSNEKYTIHLEGPIVYVFYLGVGILFCVAFCLFSVICSLYCGDICLMVSPICFS